MHQTKNGTQVVKIDHKKGRPSVDYDTVHYGCAICNRGFSTLQSLNAHAFRDHRISAKVLVTSGQGKAPSGTFGRLSETSGPSQARKRSSSDVEPDKDNSGGFTGSLKKRKLTPVAVTATRGLASASEGLNGNETVTSGNSSSPDTSSAALNEPDAGVLGLITDPELQILVEKRDCLEAAVSELQRKIRNLATLEKVHKSQLKRLKEQAKLLQEKVSQTKIELHSDPSENKNKDEVGAGIKLEPQKIDENSSVITTASSLVTTAGGNYSPIGSPDPSGHVEQVTACPSSKMKAPNTNEGEREFREHLKMKFTQLFSRDVGTKNSDKPEKMLAEVIGNVTRFQKVLQEFVLGQMETTKKKIRERILALEEKQRGLQKETYDGLKKLERLKEDLEKMKKFVDCLQQALQFIRE